MEVDSENNAPSSPMRQESDNDRPPPEKNEIKIEYHPSSHKEPLYFSFYDYNPAADLGTSSTEADESETHAKNKPWHPFRSRLDFEVAELILDTHMNKKQTDALISLIKQCANDPDSFTLSDSKDLSNVWQAARTRTTAFEHKTIKIPYPKTKSKTFVEFDVWSRPLWEWCHELLTDHNIVSKFQWDAQRLYKFNGTNFERCINEPWTADAWWNAQSRIPEGGQPLCILLYADKTQLTSFGTAKGYPVLARCANLPVELRNGKGVAGGRLVGWLPIVKEDAGETGKRSFVNLKRIVWHDGFKEILKSIVEYAKTGIWQNCADGIRRWLFPIILILSADYEEQCFMALIRGIGSLFPCPVCLVPQDELSDLLKEFEPRTTTSMKKVYEEAQELGRLKRADAKEAKLKSHGLRDVENVFWSLENTDVYSAISWDRLHAYHEGLFSDHLWELFKGIVERLGKDSAHLIDTQIDAIPRWSGLNHFASIMKTGEFADGSKYEDMSKIIVYASHNVLNPETTEEGYLLLKLIRSYLELDMYASLTMHTDTTLAAGHAELLVFNNLLKKYKKDYPDKNWNFPKAHTHQHLFGDIKNKGVTRNFNSKPNENAHRPLKKFYLHHSNFKKVDPQILRLDENSVVALMIRAEIDADAERAAAKTNESADLGPQDQLRMPNILGSDHISVGSPLSANSLAQTEADNAQDLAFRDFRKKIIPYQYVKVHYESVIDWEIKTNILRINPNFHHNARYDYVLLQARNDDYIFAQLLHVFGILYNDQTHYLALIMPMDVPVPRSDSNRGRDRDLRFTRVISRPRSAAVVVDIEAILRGALLVKDVGAELPGEHIVLEVIDPDLWWRMKSIKLANKVDFA
ncbi:hypothetical protein BDZ97DRAFT_1901552 [Flammula alnicola]|nr:hypothetical protein BDZ97DRAFT_1901552 [Flammula alnicola]